MAFVSYHPHYLIIWAFLLSRSQTTKGIWMAKAVGIEPCTIVMDLEGTDGRERGEVKKKKKRVFFVLQIIG